ncbi:MAG: ATP synthase F1 subunit gamma [Dehalococcoidia bacterium]|nr:ATP synthase F1 subunit gamma [Dehalococcoidia bacterium]
MLSPRVLRRRIKSVQSTAKITRAMEMIATAKMKRTQEAALSGRPYSEKMNSVISRLAASLTGDAESVPVFLKTREVKRIAIVHITTDRGLCGGLNSNVNRMAASFMLKEGKAASIVAVGRKGRDFMCRNGVEVRADFAGVGDSPKLIDTLSISRVAMDDYLCGYVDAVYLSYPRFISMMVQRPTIERLVPVEPEAMPKGQLIDYIFEPGPGEVLERLLPKFIEMQVYHAVLEAVASEQSARMVAMRNATDSAKEMVADLTLVLNKARQEMITKELLDITGGVAALS